MKQRTRNKLTSMLLVFCMILSLLPSSVIAAGETEQTGVLQPVTTAVTEETVAAAAPSNPLKLAESCNILRYVNENVFMQGNHIARLNAEETLSSYVFLNSDGTKTVYYMDEEVKYIASDGTIQEKDITLTTATGGYTTVCNDVKLNLPTNPANGISLVYGNYSATLKPQGRTFSKSPVLENNTVTYPDYFGEGMDLVYTPTLSGVKEDIVLDSYTGVNSFTFMLNTRGLNLYQANGRYFLAPSKVSDMRIELGDIVSFDARGRFSVGTMTATTIKAGNLYQLTITVDESFLTNENTTYPVSIDPTLTVSDNTHGAGAIEDATLYSGVPSLNSGGWTYLHCGYYDSTYQVSRTAIGVSGMIEDDEFWQIHANTITSAKFYIREAGWTAGVTVNMHEISTSWSENTITWSTHGSSYSSTVIASASPSYGNYAEFDITELIQDWRRRADYGYGFMLVSSNETSVDKTLYSSEHGTTESRPYLVINYESTGGTLSNTSLELNEGEVRYLSMYDVYDTVTWTSSDTTVATVNSSGLVTAIKAGTATITASVPGYAPKTCTVYVTIPDGVYYIENLNSSYYLHVKFGHIDNYSDVCQHFKASDSTDVNYRIRQMWKIKHLGLGRYSIRPMNKLDKGLDVTSGNVDIYDIGTSDTLAGVPDYGEWTIEWGTEGYIFKNGGDSDFTMQIADSSSMLEASVIASVYSESLNCQWKLSPISSPPSGVYWFNTNTNSIVSGNEADTRYIIYGTTYNVNELGLVAISYSPTSISQSFTWDSGDISKATVNSSTGAIVGTNSGEVRISAQRYMGGSYQTLYCPLIVIGADQYNSGVRIATVNGKQYYDFTIPINRLFGEAVAVCREHRCMSWAQYCEWAYDISILYEPSLSEHLGMQLGSFLWFYEQVNHGAVWDIKREVQWNAALPGVPYLREDNGDFIDFVFRGETTTAEGLGNIMYGYTGRATGFGEITLYWGGGVAAQGSVNSEDVTTPPYYGDSIEDHYNIKKGYDMFNSDYPDYPNVGYDGIPLDGWLADIADVILDPGT